MGFRALQVLGPCGLGWCDFSRQWGPILVEVTERCQKWNLSQSNHGSLGNLVWIILGAEFMRKNIPNKPVLEFGFRNLPWIKIESRSEMYCRHLVHHSTPHVSSIVSSWLLMTPMTKHGAGITSSWGHCHCHWDGLLGLFLRMLPDQGETWKRGYDFFPTSHEQWLFTTLT